MDVGANRADSGSNHPSPISSRAVVEQGLTFVPVGTQSPANYSNSGKAIINLRASPSTLDSTSKGVARLCADISPVSHPEAVVPSHKVYDLFEAPQRNLSPSKRNNSCVTTEGKKRHSVARRKKNQS